MWHVSGKGTWSSPAEVACAGTSVSHGWDGSSGLFLFICLFFSKQELVFEPAYINVTIELVGVVLSGNGVEGEVSEALWPWPRDVGEFIVLPLTWGKWVHEGRKSSCHRYNSFGITRDGRDLEGSHCFLVVQKAVLFCGASSWVLDC